MESHSITIFILCSNILLTAGVSDSSFCPQLGCDGAGTFSQDEFPIPTDTNRSVAWSSSPSSLKMNSENENCGCVGSSKVVVCPYRKSTQDNTTRHIMLNTDTGEEYDTAGYDTLENVNMPIITKDNLVFATDSTHVSLVDPLNGRSYITKLSTDNPQGMHSPIYLPNLNFFIVLGNLSAMHSVYKRVDGANGVAELKLLTTFTIKKTGKACPWLPVTELTANRNRAYFYGYHIADIGGIVAIEFMAEAPHYKKVWELSDEMRGSMMPERPKEVKREMHTFDNCTAVPDVDPDYSIFPPVDVNTQMIATPDKYIVITSPVGLITVKDHRDSGEQVAISLFGAHFLSLDTSPVKNGDSPIVWMTGWPQYAPFRPLLAAFNYTNPDVGRSANWYIGFDDKLGISGFNVTSRFTMFEGKVDDGKILAFGATVNLTKEGSPFQTQHCNQCTAGINHVVMAVKTEYNNTENPHIYWVIKLPLPYMEVRGQIIGVSNKLVMYASNSSHGNIVAIK